jgi:hypothetical protein
MPAKVKSIKKGVVATVGTRNNIGVKYPRWHAKHPANNVILPQSVAPTK